MHESHIIHHAHVDDMIVLDHAMGHPTAPIPIKNTHIEMPKLEIARAYFADPKPPPPWRKRRQRRR